MPTCPICEREVEEDELLEGIGPCWNCKVEIDNMDLEEELNAKWQE